MISLRDFIPHFFDEKYAKIKQTYNITKISNRIDALMTERGLTKKQFSEAMGRCPSEITK